MASSSSSATSTLLEDYLGGRLPAARLVPAIAAEFYRARGARREGLRPLMEVIERAAPGVAHLVRAAEGPGFDIRLAERPFPPEYEAELRRAAQALLERPPAAAAPAAAGGFWARLLGRVRRLFSATA